jgi:hypothetical protein
VEAPRLTPAAFIESTAIEVVNDQTTAILPFTLWAGQRQALATMEQERLIVFLKARQLGISWLACGFALWLCTTFAGQTVLVYSQGQLEANELIRRTSFLYDHHALQSQLPPLIRDNTGMLEWSNGSRMLSLAATRRAGRSFTGALVILDEWAFMQWGGETLAAVKPTIDAGGKLFIISSADGNGTPYHQHWLSAKSGANGYVPLFLPWQARPDRGSDWRDDKLAESGGDTATIFREYPANDIEAFTHASGLVYDVWSDGPADGNVTEAAAYQPGGGDLFWAIDDGYEGVLDRSTGQYTEKSAPRVFLLVQQRPTGQLCVFAEHYAVKTLQEAHIGLVRALGYPDPEYAVVDSAAAELRGRLLDGGVGTFGKPGSIEESIKTTRRMLAPDANGVRRVLVHPSCTHLRAELASYRRDDSGKPIDAQNHGPDALRYLCWHMRLE